MKGMNDYYMAVPLSDVVFHPSAIASTVKNFYQEAYIVACETLAVAPQKKVGRPSFRHDRLREEASNIANFWIEEDNPCKINLSMNLESNT
jgi:hypothetical protein